MNWAIDLIIAFLVLGIIEAIIKPIARVFIRNRVMRYAPVVLERIDEALPVLLHRANGEDIEDYTRRVLHEITGEDWSERNVEPIFQSFDIRKAADRLKENTEPSISNG